MTVSLPACPASQANPVGKGFRLVFTYESTTEFIPHCTTHVAVEKKARRTGIESSTLAGLLQISSTAEISLVNSVLTLVFCPQAPIKNE